MSDEAYSIDPAFPLHQGGKIEVRPTVRIRDREGLALAYTPGVAFQMVDQLRERVRLSEGMGAENTLRPEPIERAVHLMKVFKALCEANGIRCALSNTAGSMVGDAAAVEVLVAEGPQRVRDLAQLGLQHERDRSGQRDGLAARSGRWPHRQGLSHCHF